MDVQGKVIPGTKNCMCKGPEAGVCLVCSRKHKGESEGKVEEIRGRMVGDEIRDVAGG